MIILVPAVLWIGRNRSVMPSEFHPFGVGAGMALWGRAIELKEPDQKQRTALLAANREYVIAHEGTNPALQSKADADLFRAASEVIRSRWIEFVRLTVFLIVFREWSETYDPKLPTPVLWLVTVGSSALLGLGYVGIALMRTRWTLTVPLVVLCFGVAAVHAPFATEARYTAPVRPILYMFSALTVAWMLNVRTYGRRGAGRRDAALSQ